MAAIAGLQDFRQEGPPADIGTYQLSCNVIVFSFTFSGTTYYCAVRAGQGGWVLVDYGVVAPTVIQSGINSLTVGRAWKEKVYLKGYFLMNLVAAPQIAVPAYTHLDGDALLYLADGQAVANTRIIDVVGDNVTISNLKLDGNAANNAGAIGGFQGRNLYVAANHVIVENVTSQNARVYGLIAQADDTIREDVWFIGCRSIDDRWNGISFMTGMIRSGALACYVHGSGDVGLNTFGGPPGWPSYITFEDNVVYLLDGVNGFNNAHVGIYFEGASVCTALGNTIIGVSVGIMDDVDGGGRHIITHNHIETVDAFNTSGISIGLDHNLISGNEIICGATQIGQNCIDIIGDDNRILGNYCNARIANSFGIISEVGAERNVYRDNDVTDSPWNIYLQGGLEKLHGNLGYNPRGNVANPYPAAAGYIADTGAAQAFPTSNVNYTINHSPKFITIYGGTVTSISIDGVATGLTSGGFFLEPGQIFNVVWTGQPSSQVYAL